MSKAQRDKGARIEREVCNQISAALGMPVQRNLNQARAGGSDSDFAIGKLDFCLEIKAREKIQVLRFLEQAQKAAAPHQIPLVVLRENNSKPVAMLDLDQFLNIIKDQQ